MELTSDSPETSFRSNNSTTGAAGTASSSDSGAVLDLITTFPRCLQSWVADVKLLLERGGTAADWQDVGFAIVFEIDYEDAGIAVVERLAAACGASIAKTTKEWVEQGEEALLGSNLRVLALSPGDWQQADDEEDGEGEERSEILDLIGKFDPARPSLIVTWTDDLCSFDEEFQTVHAFNRFFRFDPVCTDQLGEAVVRDVGAAHFSPCILGDTARVGRLMSLGRSQVARFSMARLAMRRRARRLGRALTMKDLVALYFSDGVESDEAVVQNPSELACVAWHEAGHALQAYLSFGPDGIPEYATIVASGGAAGYVVDSLESERWSNRTLDYRRFLGEIRVCLAGRAAEELIYGPEGVSVGASSDLRQATRKASNVIAYCGFSPSMGKPGASSQNLGVLLSDCASPSEMRHVETLCRRLLEHEYLVVLDGLRRHRDLLTRIFDALLAEYVLGRRDLEKILLDATECGPFSIRLPRSDDNRLMENSQ